MCHLSFLTFSCKVALSSCLDFTVHLRLFYIHVFLQRVYLLILYQKFRIFRCTRATTAMRYQKLTLATTRFVGSQFGNNAYNSEISHFTLICLHLISQASLIQAQPRLARRHRYFSCMDESCTYQLMINNVHWKLPILVTFQYTCKRSSTKFSNNTM